MPRYLRKLQIAFCVLMMAFLLVPTLCIIPLSFSSGSFLSYPLPGFSLQWYARVLQPDPWMAALKNSLIVGIGATIFSTILGTLAALGLRNPALPARSFLLAAIISPMIVPVVISAVGMYFLFARVGLNGSFAGMILAHTALGVPFVVITVTATLKHFDTNLVRAAANMGAGPGYAFRTITLPLIAPGVLAGGLFAFIFSFDEVVVALFLAGSRQRTLPRQMFDGLRENIEPSILAVSTLLTLMTVLLMAVTWLLQRRSAQRQGYKGDTR